MVKYLIRKETSMNKDEQDSNEFKKVIQNNRFKEIFKEAHFQKNKRADCKRIMKLCESVNKDTSSTLKNMNNNIMIERLKCAEFKTTTNIIQDLDTNNPIAFPLLY